MSNDTPSSEPDEFELISRLKAKLPTGDSVVIGVGDDCAVIDVGVPGQWQLHKTDAVVEGIHFTKDADPQQIGHKALGRALSDIAAMAGTPRWATVTLGLPDGFDAETVAPGTQKVPKGTLWGDMRLHYTPVMSRNSNS
mgnify:CR=1 FL=1